VAILDICVGNMTLPCKREIIGFTTLVSFWQDIITDMFTDKNPAGNVIVSDTYRRILTVAFVGIVVAIKRFWFSSCGKQTFGKWHLWVVRSLLWWLTTLNSCSFPVSLYFLAAIR
jgi:hypothetical protein